MQNNSETTNLKKISILNIRGVETTYHLPDLDEGPSLEKMVDQLSLVIQALSEITDWDYRAANAMSDMVQDIREQVEKYGEYRRVVEDTLLPVHNTLQQVGAGGQVILDTLARIDQDDLIKSKLIGELLEIESMRNKR